VLYKEVVRRDNEKRKAKERTTMTNSPSTSDSTARSPILTARTSQNIAGRKPAPSVLNAYRSVHFRPAQTEKLTIPIKGLSPLNGSFAPGFSNHSSTQDVFRPPLIWVRTPILLARLAVDVEVDI
jgi:hypothetical protein